MSEFSIYDSSGRAYSTGCEPRVLACGAVPGVPMAGEETVPELPVSEWTPQEGLEWAEVNDINQKNTNSCCLASLANAICFHQKINGRHVVVPDFLKIWSKLTGGRNAGVGLDEALAEVLANGYPIVGSTDVVRFTEVWDAPDYKRFVSGVRRGMRGIYGRSMGRGGHAEFAAYVKDSKTLKIRGTWGRSFGENGFYDVPISDLARSMTRYGAFLIREIAVVPADFEGKGDAKA